MGELAFYVFIYVSGFTAGVYIGAYIQDRRLTKRLEAITQALMKGKPFD